jgi:hypothetical protein
MATDRHPSGRTSTRKSTVSTAPTNTVTPAPSHDQPWIMFSLNSIQEQINRIEDRLRRFERFVWISQGIVITVVVIWAVVQFVFSNFQVDISPKP